MSILIPKSKYEHFVCGMLVSALIWVARTNSNVSVIYKGTCPVMLMWGGGGGEGD